MPRMTAPVFCNFLYASRNPLASMVQPGVSALGKKNSTTVLPRKSFKETFPPFWSGKINSGALSLISMDVSRLRLYPTIWRLVIPGVLGLGLFWTIALAQVGKAAKPYQGPRAL